MNKNKIGINSIFLILLIAIIGIILYTTITSKSKKESNPPINFTTSLDDLQIAAISDLHIGANSQALINPIGNYTNKILDSFIEQIIQQDIDVLLLCGDNSNSGRPYQHEELVKHLQKVLDHDITILAIPGNHDIAETTTKQFRFYYDSLGYKKALSEDTDSLSYSVVVDHTLFLMIDTDGYTQLSKAKVSTKTLKWIKEQLEYATKNHFNVLPVGHYPLLTSNTTPFTNQKELINLLREYSIPLYICGHLHGRNVTSDGKLNELVVEQTPSYPCVYSNLIISSSGNIQYQPLVIEVEEYAKSINSNDQNLLDFDEYKLEMQTKWAKDTVELIAKDHRLSKEELEDAKDFFAELLEHVYSGNLYHHMDSIKNHPGRKIFEEIAKDTNYGPWLPKLYENANPYTEGFQIVDGNLLEIS